MSARDGGSAYPNDGAWANGHPESGLSIRQAYKIAALQGLLTSGKFTREVVGRPCVADDDLQSAARIAAYVADAMLAEDAEFAAREGK